MLETSKIIEALKNNGIPAADIVSQKVINRENWSNRYKEEGRITYDLTVKLEDGSTKRYHLSYYYLLTCDPDANREEYEVTEPEEELEA